MEWWLNHVGQMAQSVQDYSADGYIYWKKKYYIAQVDIKSGKKKIIAEGVSDDKIIYTKGILRYVDADGNTKISGCR